jgi:ParB family chromosome partitioning protein
LQYGDHIDESMRDDTRENRAAIKIRPNVQDRLKDTSRLPGAMQVPVSRVIPDPSQPRKEFDSEATHRLAESIKSRGVLQPIRVRFDDVKNAWVIVSGERRWRAAGLLGMATIPVIEVSNRGDDDDLCDQLVENCLRADLTAIEQAAGMRRLLDMTNWTQDHLAQELGLSKGHVSRMLSLLEAPKSVQRKVAQGKISVQAGVALARVEPEIAEKLAEQGGGTEQIVAETAALGRKSLARTSKVAYDVENGTVEVTLSKANASRKDFAAAIRQALTQASRLR